MSLDLSSDDLEYRRTRARIAGVLACLPFSVAVNQRLFVLDSAADPTADLKEIAIWLETYREDLRKACSSYAEDRQELRKLQEDLAAVRRIFGVGDGEGS